VVHRYRVGVNAQPNSLIARGEKPRTDRSTYRNETRTITARHSAAEPEDVLVVEGLTLQEEEDEPLGWLISLLVEENANKG
jgi:hypothetical protein